MNGFIRKGVAYLCLGAGVGVLVGCASYRKCVDPCWPERYNAMARASVREPFNAQAFNGHVLDQTVWNYHWVHDARTGQPTDQLHPAGIEHLQYLSRRRPAPDLHVFLATAQDIPYTAGSSPDRIMQARADLDQKRVQAIQAFMTAQLAPRGIVAPVEVTVCDPAPVGLPAEPLSGSLPMARPYPILGGWQKLELNFQGKLPGASGVTLSTPGGVGASGTSQ